MTQELNELSQILNMKFLQKIGLTRADNFCKWKSGARKPKPDDIRRLRGDIGRMIVKLQNIESKLNYE